MSRRPIDRSPALKKLRDEGFDIEVVDGYLLMHDVPYVNDKREVKRGILMAALDLTNDIAQPPSDHQAKWAGDCPCNEDGSIMQGLGPSQAPTVISGHQVKWNFSCKPKPADKYDDFHHKMSHYAIKISGPAQAIDPAVTAQTFKPRQPDPDDSVFLYEDTASSRADIVAINDKLKSLRIGIVGLGGTGSYVLDFVAKTPVKEIHLFDGDTFDQHNAFRAPGAASGEELEQRLTKVAFHARTYGKMRRGIVVHPTRWDLTRCTSWKVSTSCSSAWRARARGPSLRSWRALGIPFVDVGMGIAINGNCLRGQIRTTTSTPTKRDHVYEKNRIAFTTADEVNEYDKNIQVVELNALNAALAVIKWKKLFGFYADDNAEHFSIFVIAGNEIINEDAE